MGAAIPSLLARWGSRCLWALLALSLILGLAACSGNKLSDRALEEKILQVVRDNPQVIVDSVNAHQQQQQQQAREQALQQKLASKDPASLIGNSPTLGAAERTIVLLEFSDFQCPFCARAHATLKPFIEKHKDEVTLVYKHLPLTNIHAEALPAALASWAAQQQGKFWEYHDALFANQDKLGEEFYVATAKGLKLDLDRFNKDRRSEAAKAAIQKDIDLANEFQISGTPFFIMNRIPFSGAVPAEFLEQTLARAKQALGK